MATTNLDALTLSGALAVTGATTLTGALSVDSTTASTSAITGSIHTDGGLGVAGAAYIGGDLNATKIITTYANPSAAYNGIYTTVTQSTTYSGSIAGIRSTLTCSAAASIGNMYAGRFELIQSATPTGQGHTTALYAQVTATGTGNNPTSVLTLCHAGASTGTSTPFINFLDAATNKTTVLFEIGTGNAVGTGTSGTALFETSASIGDANEITAGLRVKVNGTDYYLLMATPTDIQD